MKARLLVLSFVTGAHFAIVQTSYFLVLEAFVSSQALSYFVAIFFWLLGLLVGLRVRREGLFLPLLGVGAASYYATWLLARFMPFATSIYLVAGACSVLSGLLPGYFFRFVGTRVQPVSRALLHENNGFILGLVVALVGATRFGATLVAFGPLMTVVAAALAYLAIGDGGRGLHRSRTELSSVPNGASTPSLQQ